MTRSSAKKPSREAPVPSTWIRILDTSGERPNPPYHAVIAQSPTQMVTACEKLVDNGEVKDSQQDPRYRCGSCDSRINSVPYLLPSPERLAELLGRRTNNAPDCKL